MIETLTDSKFEICLPTRMTEVKEDWEICAKVNDTCEHVCANTAFFYSVIVITERSLSLIRKQKLAFAGLIPLLQHIEKKERKIRRGSNITASDGSCVRRVKAQLAH